MKEEIEELERKIELLEKRKQRFEFKVCAVLFIIALLLIFLT